MDVLKMIQNEPDRDKRTKVEILRIYDTRQDPNTLTS